MEYTFNCGVGANKELAIKKLVEWCINLEPNDHLIVYDFGNQGDLRLDIYKDEDYDRERNEYNMVRIYTSQMQEDGMVYDIDDTDNIYVENGELAGELERIYEEKDMELL